MIETANNEEGKEHGVDYQENDNDNDYQDNDNDNTEPVCSSDKHGSVGIAVDTTS